MTTCRKNENSRNRSGTELSIIESSNYHWPFSQCCQFIKSDILMCLCNIVDQSGFQSIGLPVWNFKLSIYHFVSHGVVLLVCRSDGLSVCEFSSLSIWHSVSLWVRRSVDHLQVCRSVGQSSSQSFGLLVCPLIILSFCLVYQSITLSTRKTVSLSFFQSMTFTGYRSVILTVCHFVRLLVICVSISQSVRQLVCPDMSHSSLPPPRFLHTFLYSSDSLPTALVLSCAGETSIVVKNLMSLWYVLAPLSLCPLGSFWRVFFFMK